MGIGINDSIELEGDYWKRLEPKPYEEVLTTAQNNISNITCNFPNIYLFFTFRVHGYRSPLL